MEKTGIQYHCIVTYLNVHIKSVITYLIHEYLKKWTEHYNKLHVVT